MSGRLLNTAILIPVFNKLEYTKKCLASLDALIFRRNLNDYFSIVLIDDGSTDGTSGFVKSAYPYVHIIKGDGNLWWSGSINAGAVYAKDQIKADYVLLWNNDIGCDQDYFRRLIELQKELRGDEIVGSKIYCDTNYLYTWSTGGYFNNKTGAIHMMGFNKPDSPDMEKNKKSIQWLAGMGTLIPVSVFDRIGLWDSTNYPQYIGDLEFTYRAYLHGYKLTVDNMLKISNDTRNSSLNHEGNFKKLINLFTDLRSLYNYRVNKTFVRTYGKGPFKYSNMIKMYVILMLSYMKQALVKRK